MKNWKYTAASVSSTCFPLWYVRQALTAHPQNTISQNVWFKWVYPEEGEALILEAEH